MEHLIELKDVYKIYHMGDEDVHALDGVSLTIDKGEFVAIVGQSGSGKSTAMNIIGCLDVPTSGTYHLGGVDVSTMDDDQQAEIRNKMLGFIFQQYNLIPKLTVLENVELPLLYAGVGAEERKERAVAALGRVGLADKQKNLPSQLSGGQQQRVSIARALAGNPSVILADEPTGALDSRTGREVLGFIFQQYNLIPKLTVLENVELPLLYAGVGAEERKERAVAALGRVGLADKQKNLPSQLSGGQQQRVSIARALAGNPSVILADEPTGALDSRTGREVLGFLQKLNQEGDTVVLITHDNSIAVKAKRIVRLQDGRIIYDGDASDPAAVVQPEETGADGEVGV